MLEVSALSLVVDLFTQLCVLSAPLAEVMGEEKVRI